MISMSLKLVCSKIQSSQDGAVDLLMRIRCLSLFLRRWIVHHRSWGRWHQASFNNLTTMIHFKRIWILNLIYQVGQFRQKPIRSKKKWNRWNILNKKSNIFRLNTGRELFKSKALGNNTNSLRILHINSISELWNRPYKKQTSSTASFNKK